MGTLFSAFEIGRAGLRVAQVQLDVAGHNIANVNKEGFSRQRVSLSTQAPLERLYGTLGQGPAISGVERIRDVFLDEVYRRQVSGLGNAETQAALWNRLEDIFLEPGENGFTGRLNVFFDALNDFANNPESLPTRVAVASEAETLANSLREVAGRLRELTRNANEDVRGHVTEINSLAQRIAKQNEAIRASEFSGNPANDLRDERDVLVDKLARIVNITTRERENGEVDILLGGSELVVGSRTRPLEAVVDATVDPDRPGLLYVRFSGTGADAEIFDGELAGALAMRDREIPRVEARLDEIAASLIRNLNAIQSQGRGLAPFTGAMTGTNATTSATVPLNQAGLPFPVQDGAFTLNAYDANGALIETLTVPIVATGPEAGQTTLNDIAAAIDGAANFSAAVGPGGALEITPLGGARFGFDNDTAGVLPALGVNNLFDGRDARSIRVNAQILDDPRLISAGFGPNLDETGDNTAALAMAALRNEPLFNAGTQNVNGFYESTIVEIGVGARSNADRLAVERAFVRDFDMRRQEVSGVSIDEEVTSLLQFQRAFEGAARIINVADRMLDTLVNLGR